MIGEPHYEVMFVKKEYIRQACLDINSTHSASAGFKAWVSDVFYLVEDGIFVVGVKKVGSYPYLEEQIARWGKM